MNTFGAGGFGQNKPGGFGQPGAAAGGFGQAAGGFGQQPAQQQQAGGFGQPAAGGFGQQPAAGGFGAGRGATTGFGAQPATAGGFGQQAQQAGGFGQPAAAGGFGAQAPQQGGFGQATGGFGQQPQQQQQQQAGGFGQQPAAGGFGQPTQQQGGFGQAGAATGGFGQTTGGFGQQPQQQQQAGGFGQPAAGGFGQQPVANAFGAGRGAAGGFGAQPAAAGGFGQQPQQAGGFGQPAGGGFGAQAQQQGGFGQAAGGFGQQPQQQQQQAGGFGQPAAGGFGQQPAANAFGAGRGAATGFGQTAAGGGFGAAAQQAGGFGAPAQQQQGGFGQAGAATGGFGQTAGGFGQQPAQQQQAGGFGQPAAGGFGQQSATNAFGAGRGATTGFGAQTAATGGFGQQPQQAGGFGQNKPGGFGQPGAAAGGFGQAAGGFGQQPAQQQQAGGFGQPAAGGFGQQPAAGGFGAGRGATTGFGAQPATAGGFGQQAQQAGGFGQPGATGGFGAQAQQQGGFGQATGGFGQQPQQQQQQQMGGFGQPASGGFGQQPSATGGFGAPAASGGGFGAPAAASTGFGAQSTAVGGFGQQPAAAAGGFGQAPAAAAAPASAYPSLNFGRPNDLAFMSLPDYNASPYGTALLFDTYDRPLAPKPSSKSQESGAAALAPSSRRNIHTWLVGQMRAPEENAVMNQGPASLGASAMSPLALREMLVPAVQLGAASDAGHLSPTAQRVAPPSPPPSLGQPVVEAASGNAAAPRCSNPDLVLEPSLAELAAYTADELRRVSRFSVRRRDGTCVIEFLDPVNLVRVDVGAVLQLSRDGHAVLYPGGNTPPLSSGVNVRAEVSVRDAAGDLREDLTRYCAEMRGRFVGHHDGWCIYRLNEERAGAETTAARSAAQPRPASSHHALSIVHDDDDFSRNLDDTRDASVDRDIDDDVSDEDSTTPYTGEVSGSATASPLSPPPPAAAPADVVVRQFSVPASAAAGRSAVAERRVTTAASDAFELPYGLPDMSVRSRCEPFAVRLGFTRPAVEPRVLFVRTAASAIQRTYVDAQQRLPGSEKTMRGMLARSSRAGWSGCGTVAFASHAELRDGADGTGAVPEVIGACAVAATPFHWHKPASRPLTQCAVSLLRLFLQHATVAEDADCPHVTIHLHREKSRNTLSAEKLQLAHKAVEDASTSRGASLTRIEALSTRQTRSVISLLSALYALPEADDALPNAMEEARYLRQLRHRGLANWLKRELATFLDETSPAALSPAETLVQIMLCHKLRDARTSARSIASEELARVVSVCGEGNQFGGYVEMAKGGFQDGAEVRQRVVGLLSGKVEPFITHDEYTGVEDAAGNVRPVPSAATWKQLLGIFTFYGCVPDTPAEDIILAFLERLRAPSSRKLNPLPPYAERVDDATLRTQRGADLVRRGHTFQDAALLLLEGFAYGAAPPAKCLHPHASSYDGADYTTAFVIVVAIRALHLPREQPYRDAEVSVLLGMAAQLECNDETWCWGLLPLHLIEEAGDRRDAVRGFCKRNAMRAAALREEGGATGDLDRLAAFLRVDAAWLAPVAAAAEEVKRPPENCPSVATHAALEKALAKLAL